MEKALPDGIRNTLRGKSRLYAIQARKLLLRHRNGKYGAWIGRLRIIERLSRIRFPVDTSFREDGGYDTIPLPSLLVAFKEHDAIVACFDEESQYMLEGSVEPAVGVVFSPRCPEEVQSAVRTVSRFVAFNCEPIPACRRPGGLGEMTCRYISRSERTISFELREALLIYGDRQRSFVTRHALVHSEGRPANA